MKQKLYTLPGLKVKPMAHQGAYVGQKKITKFSQIKVKPAKKTGTQERLKRGIGIAIL